MSKEIELIRNSKDKTRKELFDFLWEMEFIDSKRFPNSFNTDGKVKECTKLIKELLGIKPIKVVYVDKPVQNWKTPDSDIQLIDGQRYNWKVEEIKLRGTLSEHLRDLSFKCSYEYILIYEVESMHSHFCDQGCTPGMGCKKDYSETSHALKLTSYRIVKK